MDLPLALTLVMSIAANGFTVTTTVDTELRVGFCAVTVRSYASVPAPRASNVGAVVLPAVIVVEYVFPLCAAHAYVSVLAASQSPGALALPSSDTRSSRNAL